jgi:KipI family sensor histidine kinase inhibitor
VAAALAGRDGIVDAVPGACTVLVEFDARLWTPDTVTAAIDAADDAGTVAAGHVDVSVRYDGPDLDTVAQLCGIDADEVIRLHAAARYTVAFCGFAPGFAYLTGLDPVLHVPRHDEPRTSVPAGSVAIAGEFSAVYPRSSPGGWRLLGRTDLQLWDADRDPPALLVPGTTVRFVPT